LLKVRDGGRAEVELLRGVDWLEVDQAEVGCTVYLLGPSPEPGVFSVVSVPRILGWK